MLETTVCRGMMLVGLVITGPAACGGRSIAAKSDPGAAKSDAGAATAHDGGFDGGSGGAASDDVSPPQGGRASSSGGTASAAGGHGPAGTGGSNAITVDAGADAGGRRAVGAGGSSETSADAGSGPLSEVVSATCMTFATCCTEGGIPFGDRERDLCLTRVRFDGEQAAIERGTMVIDEAALSRCIRSLETASTCADTYKALAACNSVMTGKVAAGQPCTVTGECAGSPKDVRCMAENNGSADAGTAVCRPTPIGKLGDGCIITEEVANGETWFANENPSGYARCRISDGLFCKGSGPDARCAQAPVVGSACPDYECAAGGICLNGVCAARAGEGESCSADQACREGLACASVCTDPTTLPDYARVMCPTALLK